MPCNSDRLFFREFTSDDYDLFASVFSNEQVMRYAYLDCLTDPAAIRAYFDEVLSNNRTESGRGAHEFAVFSKTDSTFIGFADIMLKYQKDQIQYGEIGYFLLPACWGKGYGAEAAEFLIQFAFHSLGLHKVVATCNAQNTASEKIMQKVGMVREGVLREERFKDGKWQDELRYGLLAREWKP